MSEETTAGPPASVPPNPPPIQLLLQYLSIYDSYHNHKETMAYAATALYLAAAASLFVAEPFWAGYNATQFVLLLGFTGLLATIAILFVRRQLRLRRAAGDMFLASSRVATKWAVDPPADVDTVESDGLRIDAALFTGFLWPGDLAREMEQRFAARSSVWWASILTYTAMVGTAVLVGARMIILWW